MTDLTIAHLSDIHFGGHADLDQLDALEALAPSFRPAAIVLSGDLTQRARHGEFQAGRAFVRRLQATAPVLIIPGNHDVQWWRSPFGLLGQAPLYEKYRRYFGPVLAPVLEVPGAVLAGALTSFGAALGSLTWNPNDILTKGHLPKREIDRVTQLFAQAPAGAARILVVHHNVLRGRISDRMGLARWRTAQRRLVESGADVVLSGHDHEEGAGQVDGMLAVSTAGTPTDRTRGRRPSVFNLLHIDERRIEIEHHRWDAAARTYRPADRTAFARPSADRALAGAAR